jgi:hypothetical protein
VRNNGRVKPAARKNTRVQAEREPGHAEEVSAYFCGEVLEDVEVEFDSVEVVPVAFFFTFFL